MLDPDNKKDNADDGNKFIPNKTLFIETGWLWI